MADVIGRVIVPLRHRLRVIRLAATAKHVVIYHSRDLNEGGGLTTYGVAANQAAFVLRQAAECAESA